VNANAIEAVGLRKSFGKTAALDGLDLTVRAGEVHAFLGPNGAGKTTTIRILLGLLRKDPGPASGTVTLLGGDPWRDATSLHARLAYVPGDVTLWPGLTGGEIIDLLSKLRGDGHGSGGILRSSPWAKTAQRKRELIERFQLDPAKKARTYSTGNRQKVALIAALASDAELLLLDEPTAGLDPLMEEAFREAITAERHEGRTVLLSSHILSEAEALADRVTIIRKGKTVETGTLAELRHLTRTSIDAETDRPVDISGLSDPSRAGVHDATVSKASTAGAIAAGGSRLRCEVDNAALPALLRAIIGAGPRALTSRPPTLEELFLRHYEEPGTERTREVASHG
jgi:ABC-2 type transport system ATP-binding protein